MAAFILIFLKEWIFTQHKMRVDSFLSVFLHMHFPFTKNKIPKTFFPLKYANCILHQLSYFR